MEEYDEFYIAPEEIEPYYDLNEAEVQEFYWEDDFYQYNQNEADDYRDEMYD